MKKINLKINMGGLALLKQRTKPFQPVFDDYVNLIARKKDLNGFIVDLQMQLCVGPMVNQFDDKPVSVTVNLKQVDGSIGVRQNAVLICRLLDDLVAYHGPHFQKIMVLLRQALSEIEPVKKSSTKTRKKSEVSDTPKISLKKRIEPVTVEKTEKIKEIEELSQVVTTNPLLNDFL